MYSAPAGLTYSKSEKGQSVIATLGAYAYNAWPLLLDFTDGEVHHLIMIRNDELIYKLLGQFDSTTSLCQAIRNVAQQCNTGRQDIKDDFHP